MLRITTTHRDQATRTFKLEGKLLGPWIHELESAYTTSLVSPDRVRLDLHGLTFVDAEGARFLASLIRDGRESSPALGSSRRSFTLKIPEVPFGPGCGRSAPLFWKSNINGVHRCVRFFDSQPSSPRC